LIKGHQFSIICNSDFSQSYISNFFANLIKFHELKISY
jgi:hypothetical protein